MKNLFDDFNLDIQKIHSNQNFVDQNNRESRTISLITALACPGPTGVVCNPNWTANPTCMNDQSFR